LKDTGERDEHGMQPLDAIFSSPGGAETNREESGSEDMEISSSELCCLSHDSAL
jgi:centromere protein C